jgi:hypothetical protein
MWVAITVGRQPAGRDGFRGIHRDEIAVPSRSARMDDDDLGLCVRDDGFDGRIEHGVAGPVDRRFVLCRDAETHHRPHFLHHRSQAMTALAALQANAVPVDDFGKRHDVAEPVRPDLVLVSRLADQRKMFWHQGLRHRIEMIGMEMRDDDEFDAVEDFFRTCRQFDQRVGRAPGKGWP